MVKIVINSDCGATGVGSFRLSDAAVEYLIEQKGWKFYDKVEEVDESSPYVFQWVNSYIPSKIEYVVPLTLSMRAHPDLVSCIEVLGAEASGYYSNLKVVEVPDDVDWEIKQCNGIEWVAEKHRVWK